MKVRSLLPKNTHSSPDFLEPILSTTNRSHYTHQTPDLRSPNDPYGHCTRGRLQTQMRRPGPIPGLLPRCERPCKGRQITCVLHHRSTSSTSPSRLPSTPPNILLSLIPTQLWGCWLITGNCPKTIRHTFVFLFHHHAIREWCSSQKWTQRN